MHSETNNAVGSPVLFVNPLLPSTIDFPFNFLHIEMVKHFKHRDEEISVKKEEWVKRCKESDFSEALNKNNSILSNQIFLQVFYFSFFRIFIGYFS